MLFIMQTKEICKELISLFSMVSYCFGTVEHKVRHRNIRRKQNLKIHLSKQHVVIIIKKPVGVYLIIHKIFVTSLK